MTRSAECSAPFAIVPIDAARDHRLTAMQYRVLIAILSFRNRNSDTCYPSREKLAQRTGYSIANISKVTGALVNLGWLEKDGKGGRSSTTIYRVKVPEFLRKSKPVVPPTRLSEERWRKLRSFVFERDNYTCQYCGVRGGDLECDHVVPFSRGGSNESNNLATACRGCNIRKGDRTPEEWVRRDAPKAATQ